MLPSQQRAQSDAADQAQRQAERGRREAEAVAKRNAEAAKAAAEAVARADAERKARLAREAKAAKQAALAAKLAAITAREAAKKKAKQEAAAAAALAQRKAAAKAAAKAEREAEKAVAKAKREAAKAAQRKDAAVIVKTVQLLRATVADSWGLGLSTVGSRGDGHVSLVITSIGSVFSPPPCGRFLLAAVACASSFTICSSCFPRLFAFRPNFGTRGIPLVSSPDT
jgi:hypothetical protein